MRADDLQKAISGGLKMLPRKKKERKNVAYDE